VEMKNLPLVLYTHSDYFDVFEISKQQLKKYEMNNIICVCDKIINDCKTLIYQNHLCYTDRLLSCIDELPDRFLFMHEDFILYDQPNFDLLDLYFSLKDYNIKLLRSGVVPSQKISDTLYKNDGPYFFSIQATILNKDFLKDLLVQNKGKTIWEFEKDCQTAAANYNNLYHYDNETKRGLDHYNSNVFPYMATAVNKGKWNSEYSKELDLLKIDTSERGLI